MRILKRSVPLCLAFLCISSTAAHNVVIHRHRENQALGRSLVWCPGFAALFTCVGRRLPIATLGRSWHKLRFLKVVYFVPRMLASPIYLHTWLALRGSLSLKSFEATTGGIYGLGRWATLWTVGVALTLLFTSVDCGRVTAW
jgi:hypothetical protein